MNTINATHWLHTLEGLLPLTIFIIGAALFLAFSCSAVLHFLDWRRLLRQKYIFIELTPPAQSARTSEATRRLFAVLHGLYASRSVKSKALRQRPVFSLEVVSSRKDGIRYIIRVPARQAQFFEQAVVSYLPSVRTRRIGDYLPDKLNHSNVSVLDFRQTGHFAYPLQTHSSVNTTDPIAYLTGMMTKLSSKELVAFQLVLMPTKVRSAEIIGHRLLGNEELLHQLGKKRIPVMR